jgi:hypothetical protein
MTANFRREPEREKRHREPRTQERPDEANAPVCVEFADHRVCELERTGHPIAEHNANRAVAHFLAPAQALHISVYGPEENPQVVVPAEYQASGERRNQLRVRSQRREQSIDVVGF